MHDTGIYCITDVQSGRRYVGSAVSFHKRWGEHRNSLKRGQHHSQFMQRTFAVRPDAFSFHVVLYCSKENLLMYEQRVIDALNPEFNTSPVAGSQLGYRHTEETRKKMSTSRRKDFSPMTGKSHSEESKRKISESRKGKGGGIYSEERKRNAANGMREWKNAITEDQVRLIRKWNAEGQGHKYSAALIGCSYWVVADVVRGKTFGWVK